VARTAAAMREAMGLNAASRQFARLAHERAA
jgi:hypothetical protein